MANETLLAGVPEIVHAEGIPDFVAQFRYGPDLSSIIADVRNVPRGFGSAYRFNTADELAVPAGAKTEGTGTFTNVAFALTKAVATAGVVGFTLDGALLAMRKRLNQDVFATVPNLTSTSGAAADALTVTNLAAGLAEVETLNPQGNLAIVLHNDEAWSDLLGDLVTTGTTLLPGMGGAEVARGGVGLKGTLLGASIFTSPHINVDAGTTPDSYNNVIVEMGQGRSGLGLAVWQTIQVEFEPQGGRYADLWHVHARYGVVANNQAIGTELLSDAS